MVVDVSSFRMSAWAFRAPTTAILCSWGEGSQSAGAWARSRLSSSIVKTTSGTAKWTRREGNKGLASPGVVVACVWKLSRLPWRSGEMQRSGVVALRHGSLLLEDEWVMLEGELQFVCESVNGKGEGHCHSVLPSLLNEMGVGSRHCVASCDWFVVR
jgi:hypothetical protein